MQIIHILGDITNPIVKHTGPVVGVEGSFFDDGFAGDVAVLANVVDDGADIFLLLGVKDVV